MNIQIYCAKKNFDVQKAERFFKERRVPYQLVDMKKHAPGVRELEIFARAAGGAYNLVDRGSEAALSHPVAHTTDETLILDYLARCPQFLRTPIVRNGRMATLGAQEKTWDEWLRSDKNGERA